MRLVLLFDPWESLATPAPVLYPEWGESLRYFPGDRFAAHRRDAGVAFAEGHEAPECWLLAPHDMESGQLASTLGKLKALLDEMSDGKAYTLETLYWREGENSHAPDDGLLIRLLHPAYPSQRRELLLSFGLRALLESSHFLTSPDQIRQLKAIDVHGDTASLRATSDAIQDALSEAAGAVKHEKTAQISRPSAERYFDTYTISCGITLTREDVEPLRMGWFYTMTRDEQAIRDWLRHETGRITGNWNRYQTALETWFREEIQIRNNTGPGLIEAEPPDRLRASFEARLRAPSLQAASRIPGEDINESVETLIVEEDIRLRRAMQRRPTPLLFYAPAFLFTAFAALFAWPVAALVETPASSSWLWPGLSALATSVAGWGVLLFVQWRKSVAIGKSCEALKALQDRTAADAASLRDAKVNLVSQLLLQRNLKISETEISQRKQRVQLFDFHLKQLNRHHHALNHDRKWTLDEGTDDTYLPDLNQPPEQNTVYRWSGKHADDAKVLIGNDERPLASVDDDGRYAGISLIEFHAARQQP